MNWYENKTQLSEAICFIRQFHCMYQWAVYASKKTPCYNYAAEDANIPEGLKEAIRSWYRELSKAERKEVNAELALLLGERFYVREKALVKIFSRMLSDGDPRENINMIKFGLQMQVDQRLELLEKLV